jgi:hypothetical protein
MRADLSDRSSRIQLPSSLHGLLVMIHRDHGTPLIDVPHKINTSKTNGT